MGRNAFSKISRYLNCRMSIVHELVLLGSLGPRLGPSLGPSLGGLVRWSATFPIKSSPPCCGAPGPGLEPGQATKPRHAWSWDAPSNKSLLLALVQSLEKV